MPPDKLSNSQSAFRVSSHLPFGDQHPSLPRVSAQGHLPHPCHSLCPQPSPLWITLALVPQDPLPWSVCPLNGNHTGYDEECEKASSTQYFWYRKTLNISPSLQENGGVQWEPALCLLLAWLVVYLCILRGTESTGKVGQCGTETRCSWWVGGCTEGQLPLSPTLGNAKGVPSAVERQQLC